MLTRELVVAVGVGLTAEILVKLSEALADGSLVSAIWSQMPYSRRANITRTKTGAQDIERACLTQEQLSPEEQARQLTLLRKIVAGTHNA
ncbi:hypothetical protein [Candidatus Viadribacter manganicus]|uniref:Uncharacterized protein n=1 Tax=Candidatus Viadribacter manganicus TaxID=1759059 RepID=A0A1B1AI65_9PROT|nr:hypothetical protein [Candidatus Viadribacter manganicus]ANP46254.1 hypothetical protein ATE48_10155 [Candidatus Viadribacter manganicus]